MRRTYEQKFENAFAGGMAEDGIKDEELIAFAGQIAGLVMPRAKFRGIPGERAGKLAADICRPLFHMRVTA
jgi:hypothetical protein